MTSDQALNAGVHAATGCVCNDPEAPIHLVPSVPGSELVLVPRAALAALENFHDTWLRIQPGPATAAQHAAGITGTMTGEDERLLDDASELVDLWAAPIHTALGITGPEDPS